MRVTLETKLDSLDLFLYISTDSHLIYYTWSKISLSLGFDVNGVFPGVSSIQSLSVSSLLEQQTLRLYLIEHPFIYPEIFLKGSLNSASKFKLASSLMP